MLKGDNRLGVFIVIGALFILRPFSIFGQTIEFKGEIPLYEKNNLKKKVSKKKSGFWKQWRATCINSRGAILRTHDKGFRDCMDNTGPDSGPRNNVKKSLDFMIEIRF